MLKLHLSSTYGEVIQRKTTKLQQLKKKAKQKGKIPLNDYNHMEQWKPILYPFFEET